jgi:hypothetical protein
MMMDLKLGNIVLNDDHYINLINEFKDAYIALDKEINSLSTDKIPISATRCLSLARTELEKSSMYTSKAIALIGEHNDAANS